MHIETFYVNAHSINIILSIVHFPTVQPNYSVIKHNKANVPIYRLGKSIENDSVSEVDTFPTDSFVKQKRGLKRQYFH